MSVRELHPDEPNFSAMVAMLPAADLHTTDLQDGEPRYFMLDDGAAFGGLTTFGATALLRSVVVTENKRRRGSGSLLVRKILEHARDAGVREAWLFDRCRTVLCQARVLHGHTRQCTGRDRRDESVSRFVSRLGRADAQGAYVIARRLVAEALGTGLLLAAVVGSGTMGERLAAGNVAVALLANSLATGAALVVLISIFGPISGAHFNPAVTLYFVLRREIAPATAGAYVVAQIIGAIAGVYLAHAMFALPIIELSAKLRDGPAQWLAEFVATFGLLATIAGAIRFAPASVPTLVGLYITAAYWFTASTSFANPAVTIARSLTNTFAGIAPASAPAFIGAVFIRSGSERRPCRI